MERTKDFAIHVASSREVKPRNAAACHWSDPWLKEGGRLWYIPFGDKRDKTLFISLVMKPTSPVARIEASVLLQAVPGAGVLKQRGNWRMELEADGTVVINAAGQRLLTGVGQNLHDFWMKARRHVAQIRQQRRMAMPSRQWSDVFGYRGWLVESDGLLVSPQQKTPWLDHELVAHGWTDDKAVRGVGGIHALLVPREWKKQGDSAYVDERSVAGIVERHGRYVLGEDGWRAERAVIRALAAPSLEVQMLLMAKYPTVPVFLRQHKKEL